MKTMAKLVSWLALAATLLTPVIYLAGRMDLAQVKLSLTIATIVWFIATPLWMERGDAQ